MPSYTPTTLATLRDRRLDGERQAERGLAEALAVRRLAEDEVHRRETELGQARAALEAARSQAAPVESAAATLGRRRFWTRLEADVSAAAQALTACRAGLLAEAIRADEAARAAHLLARRRREVVDRAISRRESARRRESDRRVEAEIDDRAPRPK